jgi:oxygen-independent coproporphyrinogen-3 oxidase
MVRSLYVHIPFCARKCRYCDFYSVPHSEVAAEAYVVALCRELALRRSAAGPLQSIYIGGGTPTVIPDAGIAAIMDSVFHHYKTATGTEVTVEANPGTLTGAKLDHLRQMGVNRLSIGIQSLRDSDLRVLGRAHTVRDAWEAVQAARDRGFPSISIDLIYAIPGQTPEYWEDALEEMVQGGFGFHGVWDNLIWWFNQMDMDRVNKKVKMAPSKEQGPFFDFIF